MHRIDQPTAVGTLPTPAAAGTPGYFSNATPGSGTPTIVDNDWCNDIQEELIAILTQAGITPSKTVHNQVLTAIQSLNRIKLAANTTYYVATTGSDTTGNGSSGAPWATLQKAYNWIVGNLDFAGYTVTVSVANGTYAPLAANFPNVGGGTLQFTGNVATPSSCIVTSSTTNQSCFSASQGASITIQGFSVTSSTTVAHGLVAFLGGQIITNGNMSFGSFLSTCDHVYASDAGSRVILTAAYSITGNANVHLATDVTAEIYEAGITVTLTGTPAFTTGFCEASRGATINTTGITFSGAATGPRYQAVTGGIIATAGAGSTYLPGSTAGSSSTGYYI